MWDDGYFAHVSVPGVSYETARYIEKVISVTEGNLWAMVVKKESYR